MSDEIQKNAVTSAVEFAERLALSGVPLNIVARAMTAASLQIVARTSGGIAGCIEYLLGIIEGVRRDLTKAQSAAIASSGSGRPVDLVAKTVDEFGSMLIRNGLATPDEVSAALLDSAMALRRQEAGSDHVVEWLQRAQHAEQVTAPPAGRA